MAGNRFVEVSNELVRGRLGSYNLAVVKDTHTGVSYMVMGGVHTPTITPLLDSQGKPIIEK